MSIWPAAAIFWGAILWLLWDTGRTETQRSSSEATDQMNAWDDFFVMAEMTLEQAQHEARQERARDERNPANRYGDDA